VAIEYKVREVAVKQGKGKEKVWRVLPEAWVSQAVSLRGAGADDADFGRSGASISLVKISCIEAG
jgi:hypothetical protein